MNNLHDQIIEISNRRLGTEFAKQVGFSRMLTSLAREAFTYGWGGVDAVAIRVACQADDRGIPIQELPVVDHV